MITKPTTYEDTAFAAGTDYVPDAVAFQSADNVTSQVPPSPSPCWPLGQSPRRLEVLRFA